MEKAKIKCPNCGCEEFYSDLVKTNGSCIEGGAWQPIEINRKPITAYVCKKCGRIELYSLEALDAFKEAEKKRKKAEEEAVSRENRIQSLEKEISRLKAIISNDNNTVKSVNSAKKRLPEAERELTILKSQRNKEKTVGNY